MRHCARVRRVGVLSDCEACVICANNAIGILDADVHRVGLILEESNDIYIALNRWLVSEVCAERLNTFYINSSVFFYNRSIKPADKAVGTVFVRCRDGCL